jgi:hypothetical protein
MKRSRVYRTDKYSLAAFLVSGEAGLFYVQISIDRKCGKKGDRKDPILSKDIKVRLLNVAGEEVRCVSQNFEKLIQLSKSGCLTDIAIFLIEDNQPEQVAVVEFFYQEKLHRLPLELKSK